MAGYGVRQEERRTDNHPDHCFARPARISLRAALRTVDRFHAQEDVRTRELRGVVQHPLGATLSRPRTIVSFFIRALSRVTVEEHTMPVSAVRNWTKRSRS